MGCVLAMDASSSTTALITRIESAKFVSALTASGWASASWFGSPANPCWAGWMVYSFANGDVKSDFTSETFEPIKDSSTPLLRITPIFTSSSATISGPFVQRENPSAYIPD
jgi:hypothetical protein